MRKMVYVYLILSCFSCQLNNTDSKIKPKISRVTESVYASVVVKPELSYFVQTNRSGIIHEVAVQKGDTVVEGQTLFKILTSNLDNRLVDAQLNLQQAKSDYLGENNLLTNLQLEMETAAQQKTLDSINLQRQLHLWSQQIGAKIDLDRAKLQYQGSENKYSALKKKYDQTKENLKTNYQRALNQVASERSTVKDYELKAEMSGKVYDVFKEVGEVINPQDRFAEIGSVDSFKIEMYIDEVDITRINRTDTVIISLEAYPKKVFRARIGKIYPKKDESTQTFTVESYFVDQVPKLYDGLSGEANIIVATRSHALTIPSSYLKSDQIVITEEGEKTVVTGVANLDFVEILSGIDTSDVLLKPEE
ncbi:efflux RND transporter periplasmic adaptor subunit [Membranihabitans marinus]|uniref:efflux RND transporter periplasmic adaptor subunit n=1 Tax=Membranihabitans marinus TaxID=1227546 RepID=UPI001F40163D|nr:efflux RND transporter periplasmic adaptor subunit [Membranihabitans marinus]